MATKVLVVDDVEGIRMTASRTLAKMGMQVIEAETGAIALEMLEKHTEIRLVLLDIVLPDMTGYEIMKFITSRGPKNSRPKVCFLSGKRQKEDVVKAIAAGGDDYLVKPIDPPLLTHKVRELLGLLSSPEFGKLATMMKAELVRSPIQPDMYLAELTETDAMVRSTANIQKDYVVELNIPELKRIAGWDATFTMRVKDVKKQRHGLYFLRMEIVGLPEEIVQKIRAAIIRGEGAVQAPTPEE
jgi:CheY-like chemotaxis protein